MTKKNPASPKGRQGLKRISFPASSVADNATSHRTVQGNPAASHLMKRFGLPPATAAAVAEANRWGCP